MDYMELHKLFFKDLVKSYIFNSDEFIDLTNEEIDNIVDNLIRENEYMWEIIYTHIDAEIGEVLMNRGDE